MKYIAFLRAINVGGHTVKMDHLRGLFEELGFDNVETFIASGNVIFESKSAKTDSLELKIEKYLHDKLGYEVATFLRSIENLAEIASRKAFPDMESGTLYIGFMKKPPSPAQRKTVLSMNSKVDSFHFHDRQLYWQCLVKSIDSEFSSALFEKTIKSLATFRNINTVRKVLNKYV